MKQRLARREFLGTAAGAALLNATAGAQGKADLGGQPEVRLEYLRPQEITQARDACATLFQPLGTVEWHGVHNVVGVDSLKAHALCVRAAQNAGALVSPTLYGGVGGLAHDPAWHFTHQLVGGGKNAQVRPTEVKIIAETLTFASHDVSAVLAGRFEEAQADRVNVHHK